MEKLKTYWFSKKTGTQVHLLGLLFFSFYGAFTLIFYKERTLSFDSAAFVFELVQTKSFFLPLGRWGSFFSQIIPLVFIKSGASLKTILMVYSFNFTLLYYLGFLIITLCFKNYRVALVYLLTLCLSYRNTFYFSASEFSQGLALVVVLYGLLIHAINHPLKTKQNIFLVLGFMLSVMLYYFHQLLIIPISVVFCLVFIENKAYKNWKLISVFFGTIIWYVFKVLSLPKNSYESSKIPTLDVFIEQTSNLFELPSYQYFLFFFQNQLIVTTTIFIISLFFLIIKKQLLSICLLITATFLYLFLIIITYYKGEGPNMYEQYYIVLGFFVALAVGAALKKQKTTPIILLVFALIISYSFYKIYKAHELPTKRLNYLTKLIEIGKKLPNKKYIILPKDYLGVYAWANWAIPVETLLASSLKENKNSVTFYVPKNETEKVADKLPNGQLHAAPWQKKLMNTKRLDSNYFKLPENTAYLTFKSFRRDRYYFYELIKYDFKWMEIIKKGAKEEGITVEENIWRNADYMASITVSQTPLEKKIDEIKKNEKWMVLIREKAKQQKVAIEKIILEDAKYSLGLQKK